MSDLVSEWVGAPIAEPPPEPAATPCFSIEVWDQYAMAALPAVMHLYRLIDPHPESYALRSGQVADAMIIEREKREKRA